MKIGSEVREAEEQREQERRRNVMVLILGYLSEHGCAPSFLNIIILSSFSYYDSVDKLQQESGCSLSKFQVADNIDLFNIVKVYLEFFNTLNPYPLGIRRVLRISLWKTPKTSS